MSTLVRILLLIAPCLGVDETWYRGCVNDVIVQQFSEKGSNSVQNSIAECSEHCHTENYLYCGVQIVRTDDRNKKPGLRSSGIQSVKDGIQSTNTDGQQNQSRKAETHQSMITCLCLNSTSERFDSCNESVERRIENNLPAGIEPSTWAVFASEGPYLTTVAIEKDDGIVVIDKPVALEINVTRLAAINVTEDNSDLGHHLVIRWMVRENGSVSHDNVTMRDFTQILHRPKYIFTKPGNYSIDVEVSNGISTKQATFDLEVVYPAPRNLQVTIPDDTDLPSCIPEEFKVTEHTEQVFAVFVDTPLQFDSAVAMGTNLTFTFYFEDTKEHEVIQLCENCTSVSIEHVFQETGVFKMLITVDNMYGHVEKSVTMLVVQKQFGNLTFDLDPASDHIAAIGQPMHFILSLLTTSRKDRSLQVWYGNGQSNTVLLEDAKSPRLILTGDGKEMEIIASYGEGCRLWVEFQYTYDTEGLYRPKIAVFENKEQIEEEKDLEKFEGAVASSDVTANQLTMNYGLYKYSPSTTQESNNVGSPPVDGLNEELETELLVLSEISDARIRTFRVARCQEPQEIRLLVSSVLNVSVHWHIYRIVDDDGFETRADSYLYESNEYTDNKLSDNKSSDNKLSDESDLILVYEEQSSMTTIVFTFAQVGDYIVKATIHNAISSLETMFDILVQCPIENMVANCTDEFVQTGAYVTCSASVQKGSDMVFYWSIEGIMLETYTQFENHTSSVRHRFKLPGVYDISVQARNNISESYFEVETPVRVQDAIKIVKVLKKPAYLIGTFAEVWAIYELKYIGLYDLDVNFGFDFGLGRENYGHGRCDESQCWEQAGYVFEETGTHELIVYAHNHVSEIAVTTEVHIFAGLDNITVLATEDTAAGNPVRFVVLQNGKTMETADVYFAWLFRDKAEPFYTNSPVVEAAFNLPGFYTVSVNLTSRVDFKELEVPVVVRSRSEVRLQLVHDLYVTPGAEVKFDLQLNQEVAVSVGSEVRVSYSDGQSEVYKGGQYQWLHTFHDFGSKQVNVTLVGSTLDDTTIDTLISYLMVEEPVTGLQLTGPTALAYRNYELCAWEATTITGTNILYKWTQGDDSILIPNSQYEIDIPRPGSYKLVVQAFNDVTKQPASAELSVIVQNVIENVEFEIIGNLVGRATEIVLYVPGYYEFMAEIGYGDGESELVYSYNPDVMETDDGDYKVYLSHIYKFPGEYNVTVNVSNSVSSVVLSEMFIPIEDITLTTRSPWVIRSTGHVIVKAVVTGGRDLRFTWNFSDSRTYEMPLVTSYSNQTSVAKHFYGLSGEYCVIFNVMGHNYPEPGVYAMLDRCFLVVDPIDTVKLSASSNSSALEMNSTLPVVFTARLSGSHVVFLFDYGDGTTEKMSGTQLSPWNKDMTMFAEGTHSFTAVGKYKVKVTAINPLGNQTAELPSEFWVQEPPRDLQFCEGLTGEHVSWYVGKVGELVSLCAKVTSGTDVMFDWKLGDQTDLVRKGSVVTHQYMTQGVKTVYVTAYNKVRTLTKAVKVYINYEIQGVDLMVDHTVISVGQMMIYSAIVKPDYPNIVSSYQWTFKSPTRFHGRGSYGGVQKYSSKQNAVSHTFLVPGECTATVMALNAITNATSSSVDIHVYQPIQFAEIFIFSNKAERLVNKPITFKYHAYSGTDVNLTWTFGDNSTQIVTNIAEVEHTFTSEGSYNVSVLAQNPVSSQTVYKILFILTKSYCVEPKVSIIAEKEMKVLYSQYFTVEVDVTTDCNLTSVVAYHWSLDGHVTKSAVQMEKRVLVLPPRMLNYGIHTVNFKVVMVGTIVYASASKTFEVIASPLVSKIHGGIYRLIKYEDLVVIDGSSSFDPDIPDKAHLRFHWKCHYLLADGTYGESCFNNFTQDASVNITHNASCTVALDTDVLMFPGDCLVSASNYTFELTVTAEGRQNSSSFQTIAIEQENSEVLDVKILRPYSMMDPVNADRKLSFYVECSNCPARGTKYKWTIKHLAGYNIFNYARAHDLPCVDSDGEVYLLIQENATDTDPMKSSTSIQIEEISTGNSNGVIKELLPVTIGSEIDADTTTTTAPLYPYGPIAEGKSSADNRRQRSAVKDLSSMDYPRVEEQADSARRIQSNTRKLDIVEEKKPNEGRAVPRFQVPLEEGTPGESGSSGGRQYSYSLDFGRNTDRDSIDEADSGETGSGIQFLDKLVGSRKDISRKQSILELPMVRVNLPDEQTRTGLDTESLVIKPGFLRQGLTYFLEVKVTNEESGQYGKAVSSFEVNESPVHGRCSIKPDNGIELDTEFQVMCKEWQDKHKPLMYEVSYKIDQSEDSKLIYRGVNAEIPMKLPAGKQENDYNVFVYIDILDGLLAKTSVCELKIRVTQKTLSLRSHHQLYTDAKLIYDEVISTTGALQKSVDNGDDAMSKVSIIYLASWLNRLNDSANTLHGGDSSVTYNIENSNATYIVEKINGDRTENEYRRDARTELLKVLEKLPVRDEAEVLQSAQALAVVTAVPEQLDNGALYLALKVLESVCSEAEIVYQDDLTPTGDLVHLVVASASSIIKGTMEVAKKKEKMLGYVYKDMIEQSIKNMEKLVLNELRYHLVSEEPVTSCSDFLSVWASRHSMTETHTLAIGETKFKIPSQLGSSSFSRNTEPGTSMIDSKESRAANQQCVQSHMTSFKINPYDLENKSKVHSVIGGLNLYDCEGRPVSVENLQPDDQIRIDLPNIQPEAAVFPDLVLNKWCMNVHQFNITAVHLQHSLHFLIDLEPVKEGRLFPISILLSFTKPPSPDFYKLKFDFEPDVNNVDIFLPAGSFNATGMYYIGIVDSTYNSVRLRPGQVTQRNYTLKLWWGQCLYWNGDKEAWLPDGCSISENSTFEVTKCSCNHLTAFGGRFELVPNQLTLTDIEGFFSPHRNPVTLTLISVVMVIYCLLLVWCYHVDLYDNRKGGIVYLLDNSPMDQQKFEITVETGCWRGAGTTAKISIILHGEEGMSETRELISEDDRPMFERNSRDKFILSLPDSIGRIWKVQLWHNNFGPSPSWYLSRVIVRDLNTGNQYMFMCEKWLAVEEQDGKVEREFMALDATLHYGMAFTSKAMEYMADFHTWMSLVTCPPYSGFMRTERLTVCLTMLMAYMCLNAMWYKVSVTEYRGEFGLLDLSWRNVTVGAICCAVVIPIGRLIEFLFRRSKPKHASSSQIKDEVTDWDNYPSGKPNEQESEESSEQVQPIMTYSLLDQSILNWPNIQSWAQKQWIKRQMTGRVGHDSHSGNSSSHSGDQHGSNGSATRAVGVNPVDLSVLHTHGLPELDQASSGFEDCSSLIRPKASVDSTHTTAAPSVNESTRVHKPQSLADSLRISTKLPSESDFEKTSKAPSISSSGSNKSSMLQDRKKRRVLAHLYLPYWCRYVAWSLCAVICVGCATVTIMYGYRFGTLKSTLWLQSLYFSIMICFFISNPLLILIAVIYAAWIYKNDPTSVDSYGYDIFNRQKAKEDLFRWKKQLEAWDEGEALERGVAARQRSRYLRFARPPQEKQLIEARKRVIKEKKAVTIFRESVTFMVTVILLLIMAYCKDVRPCYYLNTAVKNTFLKSGDFSFTSIKSREDWYSWASTPLLNAISSYSSLHSKNMSSTVYGDTYMIGQAQLRQLRIEAIPCSNHLPYVHRSCLSNKVSKETKANTNVHGLSYTTGYHGDFMFGWHGVYDGSGYTYSLNTSRPEALKQIESLKAAKWLDRQTRAVFVELTLYNTQSNLFTAVKFLAEMSPTGVVLTTVKVTSAQLFRYVMVLDNVLLACELLFFVLMMVSVKNEALKIIATRANYFTTLWNILSFLLAVTSLVFCGCFVYRFAIIADTVELLRSSYYEKYVSVSFITFWDEMLRSFVAILLFLCLGKSLRLLRFNKQFAIFGEMYRKAQQEMLIFLAMFCVILAAYTSIGHLLFGSMATTFRDLWSSLLGVTALLTGSYNFPEFQSQGQSTAANVYMFSFCVFGMGFLASYVIAVLSHYFRSRKRRRHLVMNGKETMLFYWNQFQLWTGLQKPKLEEEPVVILPPEFTMAEIEYQVDELLFRMNALTGSHGLPEKPPCYLTDSDCTYGGGDDGISSAGSEAGPGYVDDRLEQRVQKIEDNLCSQEPFLAQLLKFDTLGAEDLSQEREKQLRSHLELEIFRQLQIQRQDLKSPTEETANKGNNSATPETEGTQITPHSPGQDSTSSDEIALKQNVAKPVKPRRTRSSLKVQTIQDLIAKTTHDLVESHDNSSSNPDSPRDKIAFAKIQRPIDRTKTTNKQSSSSSSSEKISPDLSLTHTNSSETETIKKPTKPTFLHSRDSSLSDGPKGSPILKLRTSSTDKSQRLETNLLGHLESSSGSEQDGLQIGKKLFGRRSLRKTKSRGKGKGPDSLEPALILDELEGEEVESNNKVEADILDEIDNLIKGDYNEKFDRKEHIVTADIHHTN